MKMVKGTELKKGDKLIQRHNGEMIEVEITQIGTLPNGSIRIVVAHPALSSVGAQGSKAIFIPADKINLEFPVKE